MKIYAIVHDHEVVTLSYHGTFKEAKEEQSHYENMGDDVHIMVIPVSRLNKRELVRLLNTHGTQEP